MFCFVLYINVCLGGRLTGKLWTYESGNQQKQILKAYNTNFDKDFSGKIFFKWCVLNKSKKVLTLQGSSKA